MISAPGIILLLASSAVLAHPPRRGHSHGPAVTPSPRIVGGTELELGTLPYQAFLAIRYKSDDDSDTVGGQDCGGTILNKRYIITAAHCLEMKMERKMEMEMDEEEKTFVKPFMISVMVGEHNKCNWEEDKTREKLIASALFVHPNYNTDDKTDNDVAIVKMEKNLPISVSVQPAYLPDPNNNTNIRNTNVDFIGRSATISGWGSTEDGASCKLMETHVEVLAPDSDKCLEALGLGSEETPDDTRLCVGSPGQGPCRGDSGGPAVILEDGRYLLLGVASFVGSGSCGGKDPNIYTRVQGYLPWINGIVADGY